jgi:hypothetical protein
MEAPKITYADITHLSYRSSQCHNAYSSVHTTLFYALKRIRFCNIEKATDKVCFMRCTATLRCPLATARQDGRKCGGGGQNNVIL